MHARFSLNDSVQPVSTPVAEVVVKAQDKNNGPKLEPHTYTHRQAASTVADSPLASQFLYLSV